MVMLFFSKDKNGHGDILQHFKLSTTAILDLQPDAQTQEKNRPRICKANFLKNSQVEKQNSYFENYAKFPALVR